jgi:hypothetical protein
MSSTRKIFDAHIYRSYNSDLASYSDVDLFRHFAMHAAKENRITSRADLAALPFDFDGDTYRAMHPDLRSATKADAISHYLRFGRAEGRRYKDHEESEEDAGARYGAWRELVARKMRGRIAVVLHAGHQYGLDLLLKRLRRLPPFCREDGTLRVFATYFDETIVFPKGVTSLVPVKVPNAGADIGPFLHVLTSRILADQSFEYILKIHSKTDDHWREMMLDAVLPFSVASYAWIFEALNEGASVGSEAYCYPACRQPINKDVISKILGVDASAYFDDILPSDDPCALNPGFYVNYHRDLRTLHIRKLMSFEDASIHYTATRGLERFRIGSSENLVSRAPIARTFYAGTVFWVGRERAQDYAAHYKESVVSQLASEAGELKNNDPKYTHAWEYIFGILQPDMRPRATVLFLLPELDRGAAPTSGGIRTVLRCVDRVASSGRFNVKLAFCSCAAELVAEHGARNTMVALDRYGELNASNVEVVWDRQRCRCDAVIATGWQTFEEASDGIRSLAHAMFFFCQDLEYEFEAVRSSPAILSMAQRFYETTSTPTVTMSKGLAHRLSALGYEKVLALPFGVDTRIYYPLPKSGQAAARPLRLLLCYVPEKGHRLPELVVEAALAVGERLPDLEIHGFGSSTPLPVEGATNHGELSVEGLGDLYREVDIGVVFSATNPSRVAFEMRACGCAVVELLNEFTRFDMSPEQFLLVESDAESVLQAIVSLVEGGELERYAATHRQYWSVAEKYREADLFVDHLESLLENKDDF